MQNKRIFKFILIVALVFFSSGCIHRLAYKAEPSIRVLLYEGVYNTTLSSDDNIIVETNGMRGVSPSYSVWKVGFKKNALFARLGDKYVKNIGNYIKFYTKNDWGTIYIGGRGYKGAIVFRIVDGRLLVINVLPIEDYLKGVVPYEIGNLGMDKIEAVKAQAVAARTYVIRKLKHNRDEYYDVYSDTRDQVYRGVLDNSNVTDMACDATRGIILVYKGVPIDAKYSSTCGGVTADARELWTNKKVPYLTPVIDAKSFLFFKGKSFCSDSKHYHWKIHYSKSEFFRIILDNLKTLTGKTIDEIGYIRSFTITKRGPSRRVTEVMIKTTKGEFRIEKNNIRLLLKNREEPSKSILSTLFTVKQKGNNIEIVGRGYGHGAGMCQYGAMGMAKDGYNYKEILKHYYRGVHLEKVY